MSETPSIATIVDLLREILYDILGLFLPGAAFLLILRHSSIWVLHNLAESLSKGQNRTQVAIFIGASYVIGYAIQGVSGTIWIPIFTSVENLKTWLRTLKHREKKGDVVPNIDTADTEVTGVAHGELQTRDKVEKSELFRALRVQLSEFYKLDQGKVAFNE